MIPMRLDIIASPSRDEDVIDHRGTERVPRKKTEWNESKDFVMLITGFEDNLQPDSRSLGRSSTKRIHIPLDASLKRPHKGDYVGAGAMPSGVTRKGRDVMG